MNQLTKHANDTLTDVRETDIPRIPDMDLFGPRIDLFGPRVGEVLGTTITLILAIAAWAALIIFLAAIS